jgi:hypothetical protein
MPISFVGQVLEDADARHGRVEVAVHRSADDLPTIFLSKYRDGQVGDRSIGISPRSALELAVLLTKAAQKVASLDS